MRAPFRKFCAAPEAHLEEMKALGKGSLRDVCMSWNVSQTKIWGGICYRFVKNYTYESLNQEEKENWKDLERLGITDLNIVIFFMVDAFWHVEEAT